MKNKKGKKLVVLGAMAALLTLIGVSGSQTYAKYVESKDVDSTSATVAKWGFTMSANFDNLFAENHDTTQGGTTSVKALGTSIVASATSDNLVAPGSYGEASFNFTNSSEVPVEVSFDLKEDYEEVYITDGHGNYYRPMKWSFEDKVTNGTLSDIASKMDTYTKVFSANNTVATTDYNLSYVWEFNDTTVYTFDGGVEYTGNELDTMLGKLAAGEAGVLPAGWTANFEVVLNFSVTATQVQ